jgi:hypothetical protein
VGKRFSSFYFLGFDSGQQSFMITIQSVIPLLLLGIIWFGSQVRGPEMAENPSSNIAKALKVPTFTANKTDDIRIFMNKFETTIKLLQLPEDAWPLVLFQHANREGEIWLNAYFHGKDFSELKWVEVKKTILDNFLTRDDELDASLQLRSVRMKEGQSYWDYCIEVKALCARANSNMPEKDMVGALTAGLPQRVMDEVLRKEPKTFKECLDALEALEKREKLIKSNLDRLQELSIKTETKTVPIENPVANVVRNDICFECGRSGHYRKACPNLRFPSRASSQDSRYSARRSSPQARRDSFSQQQGSRSQNRARFPSREDRGRRNTQFSRDSRRDFRSPDSRNDRISRQDFRPRGYNRQRNAFSPDQRHQSPDEYRGRHDTDFQRNTRTPYNSSRRYSDRDSPNGRRREDSISPRRSTRATTPTRPGIRRQASGNNIQPYQESDSYSDEDDQDMNTITEHIEHVDRPQRNTEQGRDRQQHNNTTVEKQRRRKAPRTQQDNGNTETQEFMANSPLIVQKVKEEPLLWIPLKIAGKTINTMIDTGASRSIISPGLQQKLGLRLTPRPTVFRMANRTTESSPGTVTLPIQTPGRIMPIKAYVLNTLPHDLLLGLQELKQLRFTLDLREGTMTIGEGGTVLHTQPNTMDQLAEDKKHVITVAQHVTLDPYAEHIIPARCKDMMNGSGLIEPGDFQKLEEVVVCPAVTTVRNFELPLRVVNISSQPIYLYPNQKVAEIMPQFDICEAHPTQELDDLITPRPPDEFFNKMINPTLPDRCKPVLLDILKRHHTVFQTEGGPFGNYTGCEHRIDTTSDEPVYRPPYRKSHHETELLRQEVEALIKQDIVEPAASPYNSPVLLVKKPDGSMRFCVDFRALNAKTIADRHPICRLDEALDVLNSAILFSSLDMKSGFFQIPLHEDSKNKTAFSIPGCGQYRFRKMPMGIKNGPSSFQRAINQVLRGLLWKNCLAYLDDLLIFSDREHCHFTLIDRILNRLKKSGLKLNPKKCKFAYFELEFLGHVISEEGIRPNPEKIRAVKEMRPPTDKTALKSFLGLCSFYRRFIRNFSKIARPLNEITGHQARFEWTERCQKAFDRLKHVLCTAPVLRYPDFKEPFIIACDASGQAIGGVLKQKIEGVERPVAYCSRTLTKLESSYTITELECLALIYCIKQFRPYVHGKRFSVVTDHSALKWLLTCKHNNHRLLRWALMVQEFDFEIIYKPGRKHNDADGLSRNPPPNGPNKPTPIISHVTCQEDEENDIQAVEPNVPDFSFEALPKLQDEDTFLSTIKADLQTRDRIPRARQRFLQRFSLKDNILYRLNNENNWAMAIPRSKARDIMEAYHSTPTAGHLGLHKTLTNISNSFWWHQMLKDIKNFIASCDPCQKRNIMTRPPQAPLLPIAPGRRPFSKIHIDKLGPFKTSASGKKHIVVAVDTLTKFVIAKAIPNGTAQEIATFLWNDVFLRFGKVENMISDRGKEFINDTVTALNDFLKTEHKTTAAYHPRANGQVERFNRTLATMMSKFVSPGQEDWDVRLQDLIFAYNTNPHAATKHSPFYLLHGYHAEPPHSPFTSAPAGVASPEQLENIREWIRDYITIAQSSAKARHDFNKEFSQYFPGDLVLRWKPHREVGLSQKLLNPYSGPYVIRSQVNDVDYEIEHLDTGKSDVVHVEHLKPYYKRRVVEIGDINVDPPQIRHTPYLRGAPLPPILKKQTPPPPPLPSPPGSRSRQPMRFIPATITSRNDRRNDDMRQRNRSPSPDRYSQRSRSPSADSRGRSRSPSPDRLSFTSAGSHSTPPSPSSSSSWRPSSTATYRDDSRSPSPVPPRSSSRDRGSLDAVSSRTRSQIGRNSNNFSPGSSRDLPNNSRMSNSRTRPVPPRSSNNRPSNTGPATPQSRPVFRPLQRRSHSPESSLPRTMLQRLTPRARNSDTRHAASPQVPAASRPNASRTGTTPTRFNNTTVTRSGRQINAPRYLRDYQRP